ncbi:MAG: peptidoglycan-associated lipoprotein Pal [Candidatus Methylomirabilales bacterium]
MKTHATRLLVIAAVLAGGAVLSGCPKRPEVSQSRTTAMGPAAAALPSPPRAPGAAPPREPGVTKPAPPQEGAVPAPPSAAAPPGAKPAVGAPPLKDIFFDFDMAVIRPDQRPALDENVAWLKANAQATITIEGHCDERGTVEYNVALGERRAKAVKDHLVAAGIEEARIRTVSFGEERPFVLGHDESAWKWNRRAHFLLAPQ